MSTGPARRVSRQDIQLVQNLIERCLQLYMNQKEVVETLLTQAKIEPGFTELVWKKLEEENKEFFKAYYLRLMLKHQILEFNNLLEQQVQLMRQIHPTSISTSNGSHIPPLPQNTACYTSEHAGSGLKPENMNNPVASGLSNTFSNGGSSLHTNLHSSVDMSAQGSRIAPPQNLLSTQSSNVGLIQGVDGVMIKQEGGYSGNSSYMFGADSNVLETCQSIPNPPVTSFSNVESTSRSLNEPLLDADTFSFGILGSIPRNFSLTDLTAEFSHSSDILENYPRSPFLGADTENFLDYRGRGEHEGDNKRLDSISEGLSFEDFGSE